MGILIVVKNILIASGVTFWIFAGTYGVIKLGLLNKPKMPNLSKVEEIKCGENEQFVTSMAGGQKFCVKIPKDADKECSNSSECESGYCVTKEVKATSGTCLDSNYDMPCDYGYWTIEESQSQKGSRKPWVCFK